MAIVTYTSEPHGFGFTYDDAELVRVDDLDDPRLEAAGLDLLARPVAAAVLFTTPGATPAQIAAGAAFSALVATDDAPRSDLGGWDWEAVTRREGERFLERTGAPEVVATQTYWRGYPVLDFSASHPEGASGNRGLETLGILFTPRQTFDAALVFPHGRADSVWVERGQELMDGFFLVPLEREGRQRLDHLYVGHVSIARQPDMSPPRATGAD
jgi:hypothetical protein